MTADEIRADWSPHAVNSHLPEQLPYAQVQILVEIAAQLAMLNFNLWENTEVLRDIRNRMP